MWRGLSRSVLCATRNTRGRAGQQADQPARCVGSSQPSAGGCGSAARGAERSRPRTGARGLRRPAPHILRSAGSAPRAPPRVAGAAHESIPRPAELPRGPAPREPALAGACRKEPPLPRPAGCRGGGGASAGRARLGSSASVPGGGGAGPGHCAR